MSPNLAFMSLSPAIKAHDKIFWANIGPNVPWQTSLPKSSLTSFTIVSTKQSLLQANDMVDGVPWQHRRWCWPWGKQFLDQQNRDKASFTISSTKQRILQPNDIVEGGGWQHRRWCWQLGQEIPGPLQISLQSKPSPLTLPVFKHLNILVTSFHNLWHWSYGPFILSHCKAWITNKLIVQFDNKNK